MTERLTGESAQQPVEIERKFLIGSNNVPEDLDTYPQKQIRQGYMVIGADGSEARVREKGGKYTQTIKSKGDLVRGEWEVELTEEQFVTLWPCTVGRRVEKTRFEVPHGDHTIEVDVYEGEHAGLVTAEVEFDSELTAEAFQGPEWLGDDVTSNSAFKNQNLAVDGLSKIS